MSKALIKEFTYNAPIQKVWDALIDPDKMRLWYFPQLKNFQPIPGFKFQFDDDTSSYQKEWIVTRIIEGTTFAHSWAYKGYPGISEVIFNLSPLNTTQTTLRVTQTGIENFPTHPHFARERFEWGWDNLLGQNLQTFLRK